MTPCPPPLKSATASHSFTNPGAPIGCSFNHGLQHYYRHIANDDSGVFDNDEDDGNGDTSHVPFSDRLHADDQRCWDEG